MLVIGGSGSGKTRFFVKPNLMQCFPTTDYPTSFVATDPKGTLILETGKMFQQAGYRIKVLNTINFSKSMKYNPFVYIHSEKDVLKLVNSLISNTKGEGEKSAEDFWVKSERLFYSALIGYIWYEAPAEEMNFTTLLEMINASEAREDDPEFQSPVDLMFERLEQKDPNHFAVRQYKKFLLSAGKTRSSILISCGARLAPFDIREVRELMEDDEMELDTIGDEKTVLFLIMSDTDSTLFLGGKEKSTLKEISELLGKETIDLYNQSENRGSQVSHVLSYQKLGKELMTQDELAVMDGGKCIFMLRGVRPFLSDKYDLTRHPNYRYTSDADPKNVFDMERYMKKQRAVVKPTDTFNVYEIDATT